MVKLNDLVTDELVQTKELVPLEPKDFQLVGFEPVNNHLTLGSIKVIDVLVHYYHNLHVRDNIVAVSNDANDMFGKTLIDVYLLGLFNLKGYVHS